MAYPTGTIKNNNLFIRCTHCGDSERRIHIAHLSIALDTGVYFCFKCGAKGKLTPREYIQLTNDYDVCQSSFMCDVLSSEKYQVGGIHQDDRYSLLERRTTRDGGILTPMRDTFGNMVGKHIRYPCKHFEVIGTKGYGYVGSRLVSVHPLRIVEGVYDVVYPQDVCVFTSLNFGNLKPLYPYSLLLAPDGDVTGTYDKLERFMKLVAKLMKLGYNVSGVEIFPKDKDPGDMYPNRGKVLTPREFLAKARGKLYGH